MHKISVSPKVFWTSATLIVNALLLAGVWLHDHTAQIMALAPDTGAFHAAMTYVFGAVNILLRFKTKAPVLSAFVNAISGGKWAAIALIGCGVLLGSVNANASAPAHFYLVRISTPASTLAANPPRMSEDGERFPRPKMQYAFLLVRSDTPISALSTEPFSKNVMPTLPTREKPSWTPLDARDLPTLHVRQATGNPLTAFLERLSGTLLFDMKTHGQITGAVLSPIERLWQDAKNEFFLDWDAFLGVMGKELAPATGCLLMAKYQPARWGGVFVQGGLGARIIQSGPVSGVASIGAGYSKRF